MVPSNLKVSEENEDLSKVNKKRGKEVVTEEEVEKKSKGEKSEVTR